VSHHIIISYVESERAIIYYVRNFEYGEIIGGANINSNIISNSSSKTTKMTYARRRSGDNSSREILSICMMRRTERVSVEKAAVA